MTVETQRLLCRWSTEILGRLPREGPEVRAGKSCTPISLPQAVMKVR